MTQISIDDIDALAAFRAHLVRFNRELTENFAAMRAHWRQIGDIWHDDMYQKFGDALQEVTPGIERYLASTEGHEAHLAGRIERFRAVREYGGS
jgi:hypothetical protein